jgi:hypothetical protein
MTNNIPQITIAFWVIKICTTTRNGPLLRTRSKIRVFRAHILRTKTCHFMRFSAHLAYTGQKQKRLANALFTGLFGFLRKNAI